MRSLDKDQLRRLKAGMSDPIDGDHVPITIRRAYATALVEMIERRENITFHLIADIEGHLEGGGVDAAKRLCRAFWLSDDQWNDKEPKP